MELVMLCLALFLGQFLFVMALLKVGSDTDDQMEEMLKNMRKEKGND